MIIRRLLPLACAFMLTALAPPPVLDEYATRYVKLSLEAGTREPGYVDAYYGPPEWAAEARATPRDLPTLLKDARALKAEVAAIEPMSLVPEERRRQASLLAQLTAAETRLAMANGQKFSFADEARGLFGTAPDLKPLASYDPVLAEIDRLVPGSGPLDERVSKYRESLRIPPDKLRAVMDAAIAECRRRTVAHLPLPAKEKFTLGLVTGKPWTGYNYYMGNATSLIEVNTDLPVLVDRAVDLGCHEGYPGHHVLMQLLEEKLSIGKGWTEFTIYPLYSPLSLLAEGSANYGKELAFPGDDRAKFEAAVIFPLAGLDPAEAPRLAALDKASLALAGSRFTIVRDYLDGRISREQAIMLSQKYGLQSRARAEKAIDFADHYRSYVINYGHGLDLVRSTVEAAGPSEAARWTRMQQLLSEPTTPADLGAR